MSTSMEISARNQFKGTVKSIVTGGVMAEVTLDIGNGQEITAPCELSAAPARVPGLTGLCRRVWFAGAAK